MSRAIFQNGTNKNASRLIKAFQQISTEINTEVKGKFKHNITIQSGNVNISNSELDFEFTIPFDDDTEANEAEIVIYNLTSNTINNLKNNAKITITAGYGKDTGIVFSGYISKKKTKYTEYDKVTTIYALDDMNRQEKDVESTSYIAGTKASDILKDLCEKIGLPIAVFYIERDHTFTSEETIDGGIMDNIKRLAKICGVSAYILKNKIYVRPLKVAYSEPIEINVDTGLLSLSEFEEQETNADYKDVIKGYEIEMLLLHQVQTSSIININSRNVTGKYRVKSGQHTYNGTDLLTKVKAVQE